jgi:PAS domain S-box-containing protein
MQTNQLKHQDKESHPFGMVLELWAAHTDLSLVIANAGGFVVWVNPAFTRMCGYNSDELIGRRPGHILSGALSGKRPREVLNRAIEQQVPVRTRLVNYTKSGKPYWVEIYLEPIRDINGHLTGFIAVERDVTAEELHEHEIGELSAVMYESLVQKVGPNRSRNIRSNSSKHGSQLDLKSTIAKRNRAKKVFKKGL